MKPADRTEKQHRKQNGERSRRRTLEKRAFPSDKKQTNCKYGANFRQAERLKTRRGTVKELKETPQFHIAVLEFDE